MPDPSPTGPILLLPEQTVPQPCHVEESVFTRSPLTAWSAWLIFVSYLAAQLMGGALVGFSAGILADLRGYDLHNPAAFRYFTQALAAPAALIGVLFGGIALVSLSRYYLKRSPRGALAREIGWSWGTMAGIRLGCATGALLGFGCLFMSVYVLPPSSEGTLGPLAQMAGTPGLPRMTWVVLVLAVAPPLEEFLFRGVMFAGLSRSWGVPAAAAIVTVLFTLVHVPEAMHFWPAILTITLVGAFALLVRIRTNSLGPAVALHFAYNLMIVIGVLGLTET